MTLVKVVGYVSFSKKDRPLSNSLSFVRSHDNSGLLNYLLFKVTGDASICTVYFEEIKSLVKNNHWLIMLLQFGKI